jgi:RimJ/RimL family protein N-acetyltransferase
MTAARPDLPRLSDEVVRLRPFVATDAAALRTIWLDPNTRGRNTVPEPSRAAAADWVAGHQAKAAAGEAWEWAIVDAVTGCLDGWRALKNIRWESRRADAACRVAAEFRGRRFAARSRRPAATFAFASGLIGTHPAAHEFSRARGYKDTSARQARYARTL